MRARSLLSRSPLMALKNYFALREWVTLLLVMLLLAAGLGWQNGLGRLDMTLYDQLITASARPARDDIIIVAIDDYSLAELGRWPWPRELHAQLIDQLSLAKPRSIGLDVILSEPERAPRLGDTALQAAMVRSKRVILPVVITNNGARHIATPPIPELADAAHGLGHIGLNIDPDGVVRSTFLDEAGEHGSWPHFAAMIGGDQLPAYPHRIRPMLIPYAGSSGQVMSVPYAAVLRGEVPADFFTNKYVLVGATAVGLTDTYPTPVSGQGGGMPGIEISANILASLLDGHTLVAARPWQTALLSSLPVLLAMLGYLFLSPRAGLLATAGLLLTSLAGAWMAFRLGAWIPPAATCIALIVAYPLWSWRRLDAAISYLGQEFSRLDSEPHLLPELERRKPRSADILERRIQAMKNAARRVRDLRKFVSDSLDSLPDATLVTTVDGYVLLSNKHAVDYFASVGFRNVNGALLPYLFSTPGQTVPHAFDHTFEGPFDWWDLLDPQRAATFADGIGYRNEAGAELLVRSAPCRSNDNVLTGWIVSIVDISAIKLAERSRDETLRFLSHDMRTPQASILALLELQADPASALPEAELFARIDKACRKTLGLADNFVQLARAESHEYRLDEHDFQDLVFDATDEMWTLANSKKITIRNEVTSELFPVRVDRGLMTRALANLLSNAINYSPEGTVITCSLRPRATLLGTLVVCDITDQGYGIAAADQIRIFRRFQRVDLPNQPRHDGIGLGLVFVKTVIERHHGEISFTSKVGLGTTFTVVLPVINVHT
ncbi:CHASE2 and HATPase_c domain-containing protein [Actimicrobium sp. CCC2.4]|uniref:CHASE2 domain-containing protein n=1 Tax=Actimicrobium sp. CCC2.4 TaxID=3048606 RepID=UPI002AC8B8BC|nr:CHASE2 domain-containing protein [Actimicrobium sp. CCC2.4]MEB0135533.1 CHASE2 and HATPase_c domain-containing protein [Actimicrobium sp. CCC2.4]WPX32298.1 CHASE2 domain-containing protein [Actimicrobium sp. CCC2.4]